ncbi:MAG: UDP-N-acetylmuramate:L-alanyl-gamma-D-glutamyl-meso-diaminopimelate ligase [Myxococcales bacterium]|nr:UDP-N-acetylmuramate:L-alanyl-gamma-D-glutamyl-meso-diaminopimelate ligase [Myxococcota bacterium]MDW8281714.1 UDP-N-acetylmuramate:L-alanyl-gamma-D-glutamyl-meso-diaminopimelate ligase [Myxococcales bacterium]
MKLHLIGICGTGMGAAAGLFKQAGHEVRGSDEHVYPPMSTQLRALGVPLLEGYRAENLDWGPDVVVVGNICRRDHVEVLAAQARGLRLTSFPALLEELVLPDRKTLVVAGTHGKTTTTALCSFVLAQAGRDPGYLIGGVPLNLPASFALGSGPFVIEGDEYDTAFFDKKAKFLHYRPHIALISSVELDHVDIYQDLRAIQRSFAELVALLPQDGLLLVCGSSQGALEVAAEARSRVERYALAPEGTPGLDWRAQILGTRPGGRTLFDVLRHGERVGTFETGLPGSYNIENALGAIAALWALGLSSEEIQRGVRLFAGVKRRQELRGLAQGVSVVDDFAHHPTAIEKTLHGLRGRFGPGRLFAVFEPRSATSRTATFQQELAQALAVADEVCLAPVHQPHKAPPDNRLDLEKLAADIRGRGVPARTFTGVDAIVDHLAGRVAAGDTVVVMSSGSFDGLHDRLLRRLGDSVEPATPADLDSVLALLQRVNLPTEGLAPDLANFLVLREADGKVVGCVGLEVYGEDSLLRSLAVVPERRGEGLGWMLADAAISRARRWGLRRIFLLTEHATDFFAEKFGFRPVQPTDVTEAVQRSSEFRIGRCHNAVVMQLDL